MDKNLKKRVLEDAVSIQKRVNSVAPYVIGTVAVAAGLDAGIDGLENVVNLHDSIEKGLFWGGLASFGAFVLKPIYTDGIANFGKSIVNLAKPKTTTYQTKKDLEKSRKSWKTSSWKRAAKSAAVGAGLVGLLSTPIVKDATQGAIDRGYNDIKDWTKIELIQDGSKPKRGVSILYEDRTYDLSAQEIDSILAQENSPMQGQGRNITRYAKKYNARPEAFLAFAKMDSNLGKDGVGSRTHNPTNIRPSSDKRNPWACNQVENSANGKFCDYEKWDRGIEAWFQLIDGKHIENDRTTIGPIMKSFAPSSENDTRNYTKFVETYIESLK